MSHDNREGGSRFPRTQFISTLIVRRKLLISSESGKLNVGGYCRTRSCGDCSRYLVNIFYGLLLEKLRSQFISITHVTRGKYVGNWKQRYDSKQRV